MFRNPIEKNEEEKEEAKLIGSISPTVIMHEEAVSTAIQDHTCYTCTTGCQPMRALCNEVKESLQEEREYRAAQNDNHCCSEIQTATCCGAVVGFAGAMVMTLFSLPYGIIRDGRRIANNFCQNSDEVELVEIETVTTTPTKTI